MFDEMMCMFFEIHFQLYKKKKKISLTNIDESVLNQLKISKKAFFL